MIRFFKTAGELIVQAAKIGNPTVGPTLIKLQRPNVLSRVDSRTARAFSEHHCFY